MINENDLDAWAKFMAAAISAGHEDDRAAEIADKAMAQLLQRATQGQQQQREQP